MLKELKASEVKRLRYLLTDFMGLTGDGDDGLSERQYEEMVALLLKRLTPGVHCKELQAEIVRLSNVEPA